MDSSFKFKTEFDQLANNYKNILDKRLRTFGENSESFVQYKMNYLVKLLGDNYKGNVLDCGCGIGWLAGVLKQVLPSATIHGFDISETSIQVASQTFKNVDLFTSNLNELSFNYDLVLLANVLHHIPPSKRIDFLGCIKSRLHHGGVLVIFEHNPLNPFTRLLVSQCELDQHAILVYPLEAKRYVKKVSLTIKSVDFIVFFPKFLHFIRIFEPYLRWAPIGAQYAIVAERW